MLAQRIQIVERQIITDGLKGRWFCGDKDNVDKSGLGHTANLIGSPPWADNGLEPGLALSTSAQYATISDAEDLELGTGDFSLCARIYFTAYSPGWLGYYRAQLFGKDEQVTPGRSFACSIFGTNNSWTGLEMVLFYNDIGGYQVSTANYSFSLNTRYYVEFTRIAGIAYLRINGILIASNSNTSNVQGTIKVICFGRGLNGGYSYNLPGIMSDIRMYVGHGLSANESSLIANGKG